MTTKFFQCDVCGDLHEAENALDVSCCGYMGNVTELDAETAALYYEEMDDDEFGDGMSDVEADADALRNIGWGTDEDYGYFGDEG